MVNTMDFQFVNTGSTPVVRSISSKEAKQLIIAKHYSGRCRASQYAFGLFENEGLVGAVTYGTPSSPQVRRSICPSGAARVLELNRLVIATATPNAASMLIGRTLRLLPSAIVVSYADQGQQHIGYVYQATNAWYAGSTTPHDNEYIVDGKRVHPRTLAARGITNPKQWARENGIIAAPIEPKHRYVYLVGTKRDTRELASLVAWPLSRDYPKGDLLRKNVSVLAL